MIGGEKLKKITGLFHHEAVPGILLLLAMVAALAVANSGAEWYDAIFETYAVVGVGELLIKKPLLLWINDGLMAVFFLLVGLELKREVLFGELSDRRKIVLPLFAALGGVAAPSVIYTLINRGDSLAMNGWAIPAATDIAFALGVLALLGSRVPVALKILLTSVAVIDDIAAIVIIAIFYTHQLSVLSLGFAATIIVALFALNRSGVRSMVPYIILGNALWIAVLKSGVHATLAGVVLALFIPSGNSASDKHAPAYRLEHGLHPWVVYLILPVFAFANAGVSFAGMSPYQLLEPVPLGIALGLFLGNQIGIFSATWIAVRLKLARLPEGISWAQVYSMAVLCGIGFTMSLFIGSLAFEGAGGPDFVVDDRLGILAGSFLSAVVGLLLLRWTCPVPARGQIGAVGSGPVEPDEET